MARYRKKPIVIEAIPVVDVLHAAEKDWKSLPPWIVEAYENGLVIFVFDAVFVSTLEGRMRAERSDWIIRGVKGELYPCKSDIFEATYEVVDG